MNITITNGKGFHFSFDNGWILSVQMGDGSYCSMRNRNQMINTISGLTRDVVNSPDAEIAVWHKDESGMLHLGADTVAGWVPGNTVLKVVNYLNRTKLGVGRRLQVGRQLSKILRRSVAAE